MTSVLYANETNKRREGDYLTNINEVTIDNSYTILHGDCLDKLKELPDNSVDSVVTDPPYGLSKEPDITEVLTKWVAGEPYDHGHGGFMGKSWDSFVPHPDIWEEVHRVLKPGGRALVFAGTRTQDLMTVSLRIAGFEVRDVIEWIYFSGFPKSHDVGKAFDRRASSEEWSSRKELAHHIKKKREYKGMSIKEMNEYFGYVAGCTWRESINESTNRVPNLNDWEKLKTDFGCSEKFDWLILLHNKGAQGKKIGERVRGTAGFSNEQVPRPWKEKIGEKYDITAPATDLARKWDGWGTSTKPSHEPVIVVTKPKTVEDILDEKLKGVANCLSLFVKIAVQNSTLNLQDYVEELDFARNRVVPKNSIQDVLSEVTDTTQLKMLTENINWSTALSCLITLGDRLKNGNTSTTEMVLNTIIELKTLRYFQSLTTLESIIKDATNLSGEHMNVETAAGLLNEELSRLSGILTPPVPENATSKQEEKDSFHKHEPIIVVRKPLIDADTGRKLTVADCVEKYGTGAINIDASRIATVDETRRAKGGWQDGGYVGGAYDSEKYDAFKARENNGRFPANCITLDSEAFYAKYFNVSPQEVSKKASKSDRNSDWRGDEIALDEAPTGHGNLQNSGGFERFNTSNRNNHPTVKPVDLMAWLVRLVTPEGGTVLDPFAGSGSTAVAAKREGFGFVAIEREAEYVEIIEARTHEKAVNIEKETV